MKRHGLTWLCGALLAASSAHAAITQAPTLPAQVTLSWSAVDADGLPYANLEASGSASLLNGKWVAGVTALAPGLIRLGDDAGLTFRPSGANANQEVALWKDITIDYTKQVMTGDAYVGGVRVADDQQMFFTGGLDFGPDLLPKGQSLLWTGSGVCHLAKPSCVMPAIWLPEIVGTVTVTSVPEPSSGLAMALGLLATGWVVRRARSERQA